MTSWCNNCFMQKLHWLIKVKVKGQNQFSANFGIGRNLHFWSSCHQIDFKLDGYVVYGQALSWSVFGADRPWPFEFMHGSKKLTTRSIFYIALTISCNTSNWRSWLVVSESVGILTIWRYLTTTWRNFTTKWRQIRCLTPDLTFWCIFSYTYTIFISIFEYAYMYI